MRRTRHVVTALLVSALLTSCGGTSAPEATGHPASANAPTPSTSAPRGAVLPVRVDATAEDFDVALLHYAPDEVTAHPGDTVAYRSEFSGEPHSIAFGALVQHAIDVFSALPVDQRVAVYFDDPIPDALAVALKPIPSMRPNGQGDIDQAGINPCFIKTGAPPDDPTQPCEVTEPEPFTGTESFYSSGFLADGDTFELRLADDIAPGTYQGFCTMHQTRMISTITVVPKDEPIPTATEVQKDGQEHIAAFVAALDDATKSARANPAGGPLLAGTGALTEHGLGLVTDFLPDKTTVQINQPITWQLYGRHAIAFNASEAARTIITKVTNGTYHLNTAALAPLNINAPPTPAGWGNDKGRPDVDGGTWNGRGPIASGGGWNSFTLRISQPGTYAYVCLVHPDMKGTVTVQ